MQFSHEIALALIESSELFPVEFEQAWRWLGYSTKQKAKNKLLKHFEAEIDYVILLNQMVKQRGRGGYNREQIKLSVDCLKSLGMMAGTEKGKEIRRYFLQCERIAKQAVEIIPNQAQEIEKLKLELELAKTQERLMMTTQAIATMHGQEMVALVLGKPDAVITKVEHIETLVTVNSKGRAIAQYDGLGITYLAKRYGFGKNTKACRAWLESIGIHDNQWLSEPSLVTAKKLPRELLSYLDQQYGTKQGVRQRLIGE